MPANTAIIIGYFNDEGPLKTLANWSLMPTRLQIVTISNR